MRKDETDREADSGVEDAVVQVEGLAAEEEETGVTQTFTASVTVLLYFSLKNSIPEKHLVYLHYL